MSSIQAGSPHEAMTSTTLQPLESRFFKTKLCAFHLAGICKKGSRCTFAHGKEQLETQPEVACSRPCRSFSIKGSCKKGDACTFRHLTSGESSLHLAVHSLHEAHSSSETNKEQPSRVRDGISKGHLQGAMSEMELNDPVKSRSSLCWSRQTTTFSDDENLAFTEDEDAGQGQVEARRAFISFDSIFSETSQSSSSRSVSSGGESQTISSLKGPVALKRRSWADMEDDSDDEGPWSTLNAPQSL
eukprot:CAMPEP_0170594812 /NCGR_PEP_ID=MMETSP0224-20130122/14203_1 /TAXON_ID=285029 /ORGANISM="Togula jolla, Strain CCCM 725" /LENGTH=243 /DNA_ID=CAMNT_0010918901 /DNA_START=57 /DNA_END=788 /DNA_ORIENTATION=+